MIRPPLEENEDAIRVVGGPPMRQQRFPQSIGVVSVRRMLFRHRCEQEFDGVLPRGVHNLCLSLNGNSQSSYSLDGRPMRREGDPMGSFAIPDGARLTGRHRGQAHFIEFRVALEDFPALLDDHGLDHKVDGLRGEHVAADYLLEHRLLTLRTALETMPTLDTLYLDTLLQACLGQIVHRHSVARPTSRQRRPSLSPSALRRVIDFIEANVDQGLRLEELAQIAQISRAHFAKAFHNDTGLTPHRYVMLRRIEAALALLKRGSLPIATIASMTGFADHAHIVRSFRQQLGVTPSEARDMLAPRRLRFTPAR